MITRGKVERSTQITMLFSRFDDDFRARSYAHVMSRRGNR